MPNQNFIFHRYLPNSRYSWSSIFFDIKEGNKTKKRSVVTFTIPTSLSMRGISMMLFKFVVRDTTDVEKSHTL